MITCYVRGSDDICVINWTERVKWGLQWCCQHIGPDQSASCEANSDAVSTSELTRARQVRHTVMLSAHRNWTERVRWGLQWCCQHIGTEQRASCEANSDAVSTSELNRARQSDAVSTSELNKARQVRFNAVSTSELNRARQVKLTVMLSAHLTVVVLRQITCCSYFGSDHNTQTAWMSRKCQFFLL